MAESDVEDIPAALGDGDSSQTSPAASVNSTASNDVLLLKINELKAMFLEKGETSTRKRSVPASPADPDSEENFWAPNETQPAPGGSGEDDLEGDMSKDSVNEVIGLINHLLKVEDSSVEKPRKHCLMVEPSVELKTFILHEHFEALVLSAWEKPAKTVSVPKAVETRYPFPKEVVDKFFGLPKVDGAFMSLSKDKLLPPLDGSSIVDSIDRRVESTLRGCYNVSGAALRSTMAAGWAARAALTLLEEAKEDVKDNSRDDLMNKLDSMGALSDFCLQATLDIIKLTATFMASTNTLRRVIWLKQWNGDPVSKKGLTELPYRGQKVFGEDLDSVLKEWSGGKSTLFPKPKQVKGPAQKTQSFKPFRKPAPTGGKGQASRGKGAGRGKGRGSWVSKDKLTAKKDQA